MDVVLKLYGERNTGTNYLEQVVRRNLQAEILPGRVPGRDPLTFVTRQLRRWVPGMTGDLHEAARDRYFRASFGRNFGWKHMNPDPVRIGDVSLGRVRFLMVVKNPYSWALSLHARPYHVGGTDDRFEDFLLRRLPVMEDRENTGPDPLTPIEVWNCKMRGYLALAEAARYAMIVRYETFLVDEEAALREVATTLQIGMEDRFRPVDQGVKRADAGKSKSDYADYYLQEHWRAKLSSEARDRINAELDPAVVAALGYEMIGTDPLTMQNGL